MSGSEMGPGQASELYSIPGKPAKSLNSDPSNSELGIAQRGWEQVSQGRKAFKGDALRPQDFLCKPEGWSGFREPVATRVPSSSLV